MQCQISIQKMTSYDAGTGLKSGTSETRHQPVKLISDPDQYSAEVNHIYNGLESPAQIHIKAQLRLAQILMRSLKANCVSMSYMSPKHCIKVIFIQNLYLFISKSNQYFIIDTEFTKVSLFIYEQSFIRRLVSLSIGVSFTTNRTLLLVFKYM